MLVWMSIYPSLASLRLKCHLINQTKQNITFHIMCGQLSMSPEKHIHRVEIQNVLCHWTQLSCLILGTGNEVRLMTFQYVFARLYIMAKYFSYVLQVTWYQIIIIGISVDFFDTFKISWKETPTNSTQWFISKDLVHHCCPVFRLQCAKSDQVTCSDIEDRIECNT